MRHVLSSSAKMVEDLVSESMSIKMALPIIKGRSHKLLNSVSPFPDDEIDDTVITLGSALHHRRLVALGGIFDEVAKKLQLDDCEEGDLIRIDGSEMRPDVAYMIRKYNWSCGAYKLLEERREVNIDIEVDCYEE